MLLLAGCGGQGALGKKALQQEATGLQSLAAEGDILASDAARGRSTPVFIRVHAGELAKAARASAVLLAKGRTRDARALGALAAAVGGRLDQLSHSGSNRAELRRLAAQLQRAAAEASKLGKRL